MIDSPARTKPVRVTPPGATTSSLPRRFVRATLFWLFGLSASILIASLWGSAVTGSRGTVAEVMRDVATEQTARERIAGWITAGLGSADLIASDNAALVDRIMAMPEMEKVLTDLTDQIVEAVFAPVGGAALVDLATALLPAVPHITQVLVDEGVPADERSVAALVSNIDPILLDGTGEFPVTSAATRASAAFSLAAALAGVAVLTFGGGAVWISPDRAAAVRNLAYRLMLTSLSLALMLRLGSWIADPAGGSTPWRVGLSVLLGSHAYVPLLGAGLAAAVGLVARFKVKKRRWSAAEAVQGSVGQRG